MLYSKLMFVVLLQVRLPQAVIMEYMTMLETPGLVDGLQELIDDADSSVVKRTIRVFTNVYRHSLSLLASGDLEPSKYEKSYSEINTVSNKLISMLKTADNEGIVVHLVRYLEAALVSHILSDLTKFPHIARMTAPMLKKGVDSLLEFVKTPYVGGSAFCVAIRALISVACYQVNLRPCVTDLAEDLINTPPPNLFDHNVRSFHKTLQRNLFRLLKRAENDVEKQRLVNLMLRVGVSRRRLVEFMPRSRKRPTPPLERPQPGSSKRLSPPLPKKIRLTEEEIIRFRQPTNSDDSSVNKSRQSPPLGKKLNTVPKVIPLEQKKSKEDISITSILDTILSNDDGLLMSAMSNAKAATNTNGKKSLLSLGRKLQATGILSNGNTISGSESNSLKNSPSNTPPRSDSPLSSGRNSPSDFEKAILTMKLDNEDSLSDDSKSKVPFAISCSLKEGMMYEKLETEMVVDILLASADIIPESMPADLQKAFIYDLKIMREKLSVSLVKYLANEDWMPSKPSNAVPNNANENAVPNEHKILPAVHRLSADSDSSSLNSPAGGNSPFGDGLFSNKDVDLRQQLRPKIDLKIQGVPSAGQNIRDPRIHSNEPKSSGSHDTPASPESPPVNNSNMDPRTISDPRIRRTSPPASPPNLVSRDPRMMNRASDAQNMPVSSATAVPRTRGYASAVIPASSESSSRDPRRNRNMPSSRDPRKSHEDSNRDSRPSLYAAAAAESNRNVRQMDSRDPRQNNASNSNQNVAPRNVSDDALGSNHNSTRDPRSIANRDPRHSSNPDPRQMQNRDPRQMSNRDPRQAPVSEHVPNQYLNQPPHMNMNPMGHNMNQNMAPNMNQNMAPNMNHGMGPNMNQNMGPNMNHGMGHNMNQGMGIQPGQNMMGQGPILANPHCMPPNGHPMGMYPNMNPMGGPMVSNNNFTNSYAMSRYAYGENRNRF